MSNSTKRGSTTSSQVTASSPVRAMPTTENPSSFSVNRRLISAMRGSSSTINTSIGLSVIPISLPFPTRLFQVFGQADGKEGSAQLAPFNGEISSHFFRQLFRLRQTESPVVPRFRRKPLLNVHDPRLPASLSSLRRGATLVGESAQKSNRTRIVERGRDGEVVRRDSGVAGEGASARAFSSHS